ncbi:hypothetical protein ACSHT0_05225 [Tepidicaulis sp. LMO-SS28]|uniref:hypothetical protein n=1 Tax=Tepidicaulis sp. LMO-SS28 TaxID=3447455 RepID=UPI003EDF5C48
MTGIDFSYSRAAFRTLTRLGESRRRDVMAALGTLPAAEGRRALGQGVEGCKLGSGLRLVFRQEENRLHVLAITGEAAAARAGTR